MSREFSDLGFEVWQTGGGCKAWGRNTPGGYLLVTDEDGAFLPEDVAIDPEGNVVARTESFDPSLDSTGRFPVPEGHWRFSKVLVGTYDQEGIEKALETFETISEAVRE